MVLSVAGSHHARLELRTRLQDFPDLWRVVASFGPEHQLRIEVFPNGSLEAAREELGFSLDPEDRA